MTAEKEHWAKCYDDLLSLKRSFEAGSPLPAGGGWLATIKRAKDIYWTARKAGKSENAALAAALDDALRDSD